MGSKGKTVPSKQETDFMQARDQLLKFADEYDSAPEVVTIKTIWQQAKELGQSASGSWLGYQANVYYANFEAPPAGEHFDLDHGTEGTYWAPPNGNWVEHTSQSVMDLLIDAEGKLALAQANKLAERGLALFNNLRAEASSILSVYLGQNNDSFVKRLAGEIESAKVLGVGEIANERSPKRKLITSDMRAIQQGTWVPPHVKAQALVMAAHQPAAHCRELAGRLEKLASHFSRVQRQDSREARVGTNVFIGHGRSHVWRDLKDFVQDRLRLPYDEFNRVPVAGITNIARLSEMLDAAACAFVIMTAEDEQADGKVQARMNVIHEVGLFQGRLGFTKAIVLLEEGCEEFTNIQGLGQIRFPKSNISAKFEEIRQVLEREGLLDAPR